MKINNVKQMIGSVVTAIGLAVTGLPVQAAESDFIAGEVQLCGNITDAVNVLKDKGYFKNTPATHLEQSIKAGHFQANKREPGSMRTYNVHSRSGKITSIYYSAHDDIDAQVEFNKAKQQAEGAIGVKPECDARKDSRGMHECRYVSGTTEIRLTAVTRKNSKEMFRIVARSDCK